MQQSQEVHERLARIETTLERIDHELLGNSRPGIIANHESRLALLEHWRTGIVAVGSAVVFAFGIWQKLH